MIIINAIIMGLFVILCLCMISEGINHSLEKELNKQKDLNKQLIGLFQNEKSKTDTLYKIIFHIRDELSLLKLKDCPEEEFKNIPFEIIDWIDLLNKANSNDGENDGIYKQV